MAHLRASPRRRTARRAGANSERSTSCAFARLSPKPKCTRAGRYAKPLTCDAVPLETVMMASRRRRRHVTSSKKEGNVSTAKTRARLLETLRSRACTPIEGSIDRTHAHADRENPRHGEHMYTHTHTDSREGARPASPPAHSCAQQHTMHHGSRAGMLLAECAGEGGRAVGPCARRAPRPRLRFDLSRGRAMRVCGQARGRGDPASSAGPARPAPAQNPPRKLALAPPRSPPDGRTPPPPAPVRRWRW